MILRCLLCFAIFIPAFCHAQHWRVQASGGIAVPDIAGHSERIPITGPYLTNAPAFINTDEGVPKAIGGLKLMRRDSAFEYGVSVQALTIKCASVRPDPGFHITQEVYLARPAIPVTAFFNYYHRPHKTQAYIGLNAGAVFARGREMIDADQLNGDEDHTIYFHNCTGYTVGGQIGLRHAFGRLDAGIEVSGSFVHLALKQGTSSTSFTYNVFYFPVQACVGYSF